ncbi:MAG: hypothetical protein AAFW73_27185, partial [Bacteroidota bacterium]
SKASRGDDVSMRQAIESAIRMCDGPLNKTYNVDVCYVPNKYDDRNIPLLRAVPKHQPYYALVRILDLADTKSIKERIQQDYLTIQTACKARTPLPIPKVKKTMSRTLALQKESNALREAEAQKSIPEAVRERYIGYWQLVLQRTEKFKVIAKELLEHHPDLMMDKNIYHLFEIIHMHAMPSPSQRDLADTPSTSQVEPPPPPPPPPPPKQALEPVGASSNVPSEATMEVDAVLADSSITANPSVPTTDGPDEPVQSPMVLSPSDPLYADLHPLSPSPDSPMSATEFDEVEQAVDELMLGLDPAETTADESEEREDA